MGYLLCCVNCGGIIWVIGQKTFGPNKPMTVNSKDIGSIVSHGIAPLRWMLQSVRSLTGFKEHRKDGQKSSRTGRKSRKICGGDTEPSAAAGLVWDLRAFLAEANELMRRDRLASAVHSREVSLVSRA
jgi:hypothetical protein